MEVIVKNILSDEYNLNVCSLSLLEGGYNPDETYLLVTSDHLQYVVKCLRYSLGIDHLHSILSFQNFLYHSYNYPCSRIVQSNDQHLVLPVDDRLVFVQTFLQGSEPTRDILDSDQNYLHEMGRLLAQWRVAFRHYSSLCLQIKQSEEFTDRWWEEQQVDGIDPFLLSNFVSCRRDLVELDKTLEHGLIHNDFHSNNTLMTNDRKISIIDFVDARQSVFVADLATSLFHLLIDEQRGVERATRFLRGYQQVISLTQEEIDALDVFVRLKLTLSLIEDLRHSNNTFDSFLQSCFRLLKTLNDQPQFVKNLIKY